MRGTALLILDMINPFDFPASGLLRTRTLRMAPRLAALRGRIKAGGGKCIHVNDNFGLWQSDFRELLARVRATPGAEIADCIAPEEGDRFVLKPKHSAFFQTPLEILLEKERITRVVVAGIAADACVLTTALDARMREFDCHVPSDCIEAMSDARKKAALTILRAARIPVSRYR